MINVCEILSILPQPQCVIIQHHISRYELQLFFCSLDIFSSIVIFATTLLNMGLNLLFFEVLRLNIVRLGYIFAIMYSLLMLKANINNLVKYHFMRVWDIFRLCWPMRLNKVEPLHHIDFYVTILYATWCRQLECIYQGPISIIYRVSARKTQLHCYRIGVTSFLH